MDSRNLNTLIVIVVLLFSCSKDKDEIKPTITINSPTHHQQVNGIDTLQVLATITDDKIILGVSVSLRDDNDIPVLSTVTKNPNSKDYSLNISYFFDDIHLLSGEYELTVMATDGENTTTKHVTILLNETPKNREGMFVIGNTGSTSEIYYLDNFYNSSFYKSIGGDYLGAGVNSYDQLLIHASSGSIANGSIKSIDLKSGLDSWNISIVSAPPVPFYSSFLKDNREVYLGKRNGGIQGYNNFGSPNYNASAVSGFYVESALVHDNKIITEQHTFSGGLVKLIPYWLSSGSPTSVNASFAAYEDIVGMFARTVNEVVVFSNDASFNGKLSYYDPNNGAVTSFPLGFGPIDDCVEILTGVYLVVHNGNVSQINVNNGFPFATPTSFVSGTGANFIWHDDFLNELFVASGNNLIMYDINGNQTGSYTHLNPIKEVVFWYNK